MLLGILVPVYNVEQYLPDFLDSLVPALSDDVEVVLLNDAATDGSLALLQQWQAMHCHQNVRLINGKKNKGLTQARATLLAAAQAEYIWYIDPDDQITANAVAAVCAALTQHQPDVLLFDYEVFYDGSNRIKNRERLIFSPGPRRQMNTQQCLYRLAVRDGKYYFWNKVFRRSQVLDLLVFEIPAFEDIAYIPVWLYHCRHYFYLPQTLVRYRIRSTSIAQTIGLNQIYGLQAYLDQARFCAQKLSRDQTYWHLLYKACTYYYRLSAKLGEDDNKSANRLKIQQELNQIYAQMPASEPALLGHMLRLGMAGKAARLSVILMAALWRRNFKVKSE